MLELLEDQPQARRLRAGARRYAEQALDLDRTLAEYKSLIGRLTGHTPE